MARRRNAIFHRLSRMRGLPPDEKMLMQRIGHLMDAALNNRQASNPYEPSKNKHDRLLYPPTGLVAYTGYRNLKLVWKAANSDQHLRYEIKITNNDTGDSETKSSYTNELRYKNVNGTYTAIVKSVGRDGSSSPAVTIEFTMGSSVMQIEGSKNTPISLGTMVKDHITLYDGYSIYAWGSVVLDKYAAGTSNEPAVFRLWSMEGANQVFDAEVATLEQTITMYPATESFANLDDQAHAASIIRPVAVRPGSFETSQSVMFSPISVKTTEDEVTFTFFLQALGRETEQDEVNLSLVLWGGFDGLGDNVPQDPWDGGNPDYVFPHLNSLRLLRREMNPNSPYDTVTKGSWYMAQQPKIYNIIDNAWTLAFWIRLETEHVRVMIDQGSNLEWAKVAAENVIFRRSSYTGVADEYTWNQNAIEVSMTAALVTGAPEGQELKQQLGVKVFNSEGTPDEELNVEWENYTFGDHNPPISDEDDDSYLWGGDETFFFHNYNWQFVVICYEGGPGGSGEGGTSLTPKIRVYFNGRLADEENPDDKNDFAANKMICLNQRVADGALLTVQSPSGAGSHLREEHNQDLTNDYIYSIGMPSGGPNSFFQHGVYQGSHLKVNNGTFNIHQMGMWNVAIDNWDGMGFNVGNAEQRDSAPWYHMPYDESFASYHTDGRHNPSQGSSLTALHYLYNQGYGTDIDWKKNSKQRIDKAYEYIFAENLVHLWQFGAVIDGEFSTTSQTLRDTGNHLYRGGVNFLRSITTEAAEGVGTNAWSDDCRVSDVLSPHRLGIYDPWTEDALRQIAAGVADSTWDQIEARLPPIEWKIDGLPNGTGQQEGLVQPADHINAAGYPDGGTTVSRYAYPGQGLLATDVAGNPGDWVNAGWRRPNITNGVLNETPLEKAYKVFNLSSDWKSYGPIHTSQGRPFVDLPGPIDQVERTGLEQAEFDADK